MIWTWFHLFIKDDGLRILPGMYNHIVIAVHFQKSTVCQTLSTKGSEYSVLFLFLTAGGRRLVFDAAANEDRHWQVCKRTC